MSNTQRVVRAIETAPLTDAEIARLSTDRRLIDYPIAELVDDDRLLSRLRFERWMAERARLKDR